MPHDKKTSETSLTPDWLTKLSDFIFSRKALADAAGNTKVTPSKAQDTTELQKAVAESMRRKAEREALEASPAAKKALSTPKPVMR